MRSSHYARAHSLPRLSLSRTRATATIITQCAHHTSARFGVTLISAWLGCRIFPMSLTTFLSPSSPSIILDAPTAAVACRQYSVRSTGPTIHPRTRICCTGTLRWLCAPHRAGAPSLCSWRPMPVCALASEPRPPPSAIPVLQRSRGRMKSTTRTCMCHFDDRLAYTSRISLPSLYRSLMYFIDSCTRNECDSLL
ncbi:hypothetical protein B0H14DRAFT_188112, partial [Mycena olivaceomarginata]